MKIVNEKMDLIDFKSYLDEKNFGTIPPDRLVIHHTYSPKKEDGDGIIEPGEWNGQKSINALKKYYEGKGWSAAPHLFIADDGIWLFTDMYDVGIHAGAGNASWKNKKTGMIWKGWGDDYSNQELLDYSIGIEMVGDYDNKKWDGKTKQYALGAINLLVEKLGIPQEKIFFHRDFSSKTCPGKAITKEWLFNQLNAEVEEEAEVEELQNKYIENYQKIFKAVTSLFGEDYGDNPNNEETKKILQKLKETELGDKMRQITELTIRASEIKEQAKKLEQSLINL